jgi:hypothetical protein
MRSEFRATLLPSESPSSSRQPLPHKGAFAEGLVTITVTSTGNILATATRAGLLLTVSGPITVTVKSNGVRWLGPRQVPILSPGTAATSSSPARTARSASSSWACGRPLVLEGDRNCLSRRAFCIDRKSVGCSSGDRLGDDLTSVNWSSSLCTVASVAFGNGLR